MSKDSQQEREIQGNRPWRSDVQDTGHFQPPVVSRPAYEAYKPVGFWKAAGFMQALTIIVGTLYCLSPVDLFPEALLGPLGLVDDAGTAAVVVAMIRSVLKRRDEIRRYQEYGAYGGY